MHRKQIKLPQINPQKTARADLFGTKQLDVLFNL